MKTISLNKYFQVQNLLKNTIKTYSTSSTTREFEEIKVKVPWGHIAGKWYGPRDTRPIVGLHGWQDNAGTFDKLAPLLPSDIGFLAIDLPGHGLSSWLPSGCRYHSIDNINILFSLLREFKWDKISIIGHSMGATNGLVFSSLFPDKCDLLIALDIVQPLLGKKSRTVDNMMEQFKVHNKQIELSLQDSNPPCYGMDELVELLHQKSGKSVSRELCKIILKRNIKPSEKEPNKYYFSRDGRLKAMSFNVYPHDVLLAMANRIKCAHMFVKARNAKHFDSETEFQEIMNAFKTNSAFENHVVEGNHYVHLNEPQKISDVVNPFINKYRLK